MKITKKTILSLLVVSLIISLAGVAQADWDTPDPAKWVQLPDLTPNGMDVNVSGHSEIWDINNEPVEVYIPKILADDFECTQTGPITDIHIWGSWKDDLLPQYPTGGPDPSNVMFFLGIMSDIPTGTAGNNYSMPGELLWGKFFFPGEFDFRSEPVPDGEGWYNPNTGEYYAPADFNIWQYNFLIDEAEAFLQEGTADEPITYWLGVVATPYYLDSGNQQTGPEPMLGWKTSAQHWNDDAVWSDFFPDENGIYPSPDPGDPMYSLNPWQELRYPLRHEFEGQSIDLAFVITPEPVTLVTLALGLALGLMARRHKL